MVMVGDKEKQPPWRRTTLTGQYRRALVNGELTVLYNGDWSKTVEEVRIVQHSPSVIPSVDGQIRMVESDPIPKPNKRTLFYGQIAGSLGTCIETFYERGSYSKLINVAAFWEEVRRYRKHFEDLISEVHQLSYDVMMKRILREKSKN